MPISSTRLASDIAAIAQATETPGQGASRPTFSDAWARAAQYVQSAARDCGCAVHTDAAGNIHLRPSVHEQISPVWLSGSHLDSVPHGGDFDGVIGVLAPLELLRAARESGRPAPPLEVVIFAEEEGTTFGLGMIGSRAWAGRLAAEQFAQLRNAAGESYVKAGSRHGVRPDRLAAERIEPDQYRGFIEIHIEQGPELWKRDEPLAIVTAIAGRRQYQIDVTGTANHAGTTPMDERRDALDDLGRGHGCAGIARGHKADGELVSHQAKANVHAGVFLGAHRLHGLFMHANDLSSVDHIHGQTLCRGMAGKLLAKPVFRSHQQYSYAIMAGSQ